jgi:hypothetical protein
VIVAISGINEVPLTETGDSKKAWVLQWKSFVNDYEWIKKTLMRK